MRLGDGTDLLGASDPRSASIGIIRIDPTDVRQDVLAAILAQNELNRKQIVIVLHEQNKVFQRPVDFEGLKDMRRTLKAEIVFIAPGGSGPAEFARQRRFAVFSSLGDFARSLQADGQAIPPVIMSGSAPSPSASVASNEQIIHVAPDEELTHVRERLEHSQARRIKLVIPPQTQLRSNVGYRLLHSRARELGQEVLIISSDRQIRAVAKAVGFRVVDSLESPPSNKLSSSNQPIRRGAGRKTFQSSNKQVGNGRTNRHSLQPDQQPKQRNPKKEALITARLERRIKKLFPPANGYQQAPLASSNKDSTASSSSEINTETDVASLPAFEIEDLSFDSHCSKPDQAIPSSSTVVTGQEGDEIDPPSKSQTDTPLPPFTMSGDAPSPTTSVSSNEQIFHIGPEEGLVNVHEYLAQTQARHITLVIPAQTQFRNRFIWQMLRTYVRRLNKDVLIVSPDRKIRTMARGAGFRVANKLTKTDIVETLKKIFNTTGEGLDTFDKFLVEKIKPVFGNLKVEYEKNRDKAVAKKLNEKDFERIYQWLCDEGLTSIDETDKKINRDVVEQYYSQLETASAMGQTVFVYVLLLPAFLFLLLFPFVLSGLLTNYYFHIHPYNIFNPTNDLSDTAYWIDSILSSIVSLLIFFLFIRYSSKFIDKTSNIGRSIFLLFFFLSLPFLLMIATSVFLSRYYFWFLSDSSNLLNYFLASILIDFIFLVTCALIIVISGISGFLILNMIPEKRYPMAVVVDSLLTILRDLPADVRATDQRRQLYLLEKAARHLEHYLCKKVPSGDTATDMWTRENAHQIAAALRDKKKWIITPKPDTNSCLVLSIGTTFNHVITGNLDALERMQPEKFSHPRSWLTRIIKIIRTLFIAFLPPAALWAIQLTPLAGLIAPARTYLLFGVLAWAVVTILRELDPDFSQKISTIREMLP